MSNINEKNLGPRWYVAHTFTGYENKVKTNIEKIVENRGLQHLIYDVQVPTEITVVTNDKGETKEVENKLIPGYVLVKMTMTDESWHVVRNITGVTGFVGPGSKPVPLTEEEVAALGVDVVVRKIDLQPGDSVFIVSGVLAGDVGTVKEVDQENRRIKVNVMFGGRETAVDMDVAEVEKLKD